MFGRHPRLAIDAFLGLSPDAMSAKHQTEYARKLRERIAFAYRAAQKTAQMIYMLGLPVSSQETGSSSETWD